MWTRSKLLFIVSVTLLFQWGCQAKYPDIMIQKEINKGLTFRQIGTEEWLPAKVPGCVHPDLLANGKIEHPFYRLNEHKLQWIDKEDWGYRVKFPVEKSLLKNDRIALNFKGLDTYADILVNNEKVVSTDNIFREYLVCFIQQI